MTKVKLDSTKKIYARIRFRLYGVSPRNLRRGISRKTLFTHSLDDCTLDSAMDVIVAFCKVNSWILIGFDCYDYGQKGFRL